MKDEFDELALARRIRAAGCAIHIPEDDGETAAISSDEVRVYQTGGFHESTAFDCAGGTGFQILIVITSCKRDFAISNCELLLSWNFAPFMWLEDPQNLVPSSWTYRFPGRDRREFDREQVINHEVGVTRRFSHGESVQGFLLGFSYEAIPENFPHGATIPGFIVLRDQRAREFRTPIKLWSDRTWRRPSQDSRKRRKLLEKPDPIYPK